VSKSRRDKRRGVQKEEDKKTNNTKKPNKNEKDEINNTALQSVQAPPNRPSIKGKQKSFSISGNQEDRRK